MTPDEEIRTSLLLLGFKDVKTSNIWEMERGEISVEYIGYIIWHNYKVIYGCPKYIEYWSKVKLIDWINNEENLWRHFSPIDYLRIGIANYYGHDKMSWADRLSWFYGVEGDLELMAPDSDKYYLYIRSVEAYRQVMTGNRMSKVLIDLDATSSGMQIMSILMGCRTTAVNTNVISNGKRNNAYKLIVDSMNNILPIDKQIGIAFNADQVKKAVLTHYYGSLANPKKLFGKNTEELKAFYEATETVAPGANEMMDIVKQCTDSTALQYSWKLPDGYSVVTPVLASVTQKIEIPGLGSFKHTASVPMPAQYDVSLIANIVQSVEGYIAREMIRRAKKQGFNMLTIFDAFFASPVHMNKVRTNYVSILSEIAGSNLLQDILRQVTNNTSLKFTKTADISRDILGSEYALS